jgi:hypothetical protein
MSTGPLFLRSNSARYTPGGAWGAHDPRGALCHYQPVGILEDGDVAELDGIYDGLYY